MRISPNQPRLRVVALACWALSSWCIIYGSQLLAALVPAHLLALGLFGLAVLALAVGVSFWLLSSDRRAGITFDSKGLLFNLGHSSAFISWSNIERSGATTHRNSLMALGSARQVGIALRDRAMYIQSYEERLPSGQGLFAQGVRLVALLLRPYRRANDAPLAAQLMAARAQTGYDVLVPESLLGGSAEAFVELIEAYQLRPTQRHTLERTTWSGSSQS